MDSTTVTDLSVYFNEKLEALIFVDAIKSHDDSDLGMMAPLLENMEVYVAEMRLLQSEIRDALKSYGDQLLSAKSLVSGMDEHLERMKYISNNIPERLPNSRPQPSVQASQITPRVVTVEMETDTKENRAPAPGDRGRREPRLEYLTVPEFDNVPKYMRGRMSYDHINAVIGAVNAAFSGKHKLTTAKKSSLSDAARTRLVTYKAQRTKDCQGLTFVTDDDVRLFSSIKQNSSYRTVIPILRHCGRVREIHGGGVIRYAVPIHP